MQKTMEGPRKVPQTEYNPSKAIRKTRKSLPVRRRREEMEQTESLTILPQARKIKRRKEQEECEEAYRKEKELENQLQGKII